MDKWNMCVFNLVLNEIDFMRSGEEPTYIKQKDLSKSKGIRNEWQYLVTYLLTEGWEPFGSTSNAGGYNTNILFKRKAIP